ncbi:hypothetical protein SacN8_10175 [Sulfolobus acidocaldarius N8]|nr:hypothetical protein SacN8_10175 [Sulfolobus acidocaldarius N8]AGE74301.1 hypothetical protein SacRon12I_10425 [Sulfolobus acidocaldarius Ron12/I]WCM35888.1 hypothetical protein GO597_11375 [Sulfolobus acidocaldarius DSM 639]
MPQKLIFIMSKFTFMTIIFDILNEVHGFFGALWAGAAFLNFLVKPREKEQFVRIGKFFLISSVITIVTGIIIFAYIYLIPYNGNLFIVNAVLHDSLNIRIRAFLNLVGGAFGLLAFGSGIVISNRIRQLMNLREGDVVGLEIRNSISTLSKFNIVFLLLSISMMILAGSIAQVIGA